MKQLIFTTILSVCLLGAFAQNDPIDTNKTTTGDTKDKGFKLSVGYGDEGDKHWPKDSTTHNKKSYPKVFLGLTLSRIDLGLATFVDNGSFTLSPKNQFLSYRSWKSTNFGFDLVQFGVRTSPNFRIYLSGGFDWTYYRLRENVTFLRDQPVLTYTQDNVDYSKNRFTASYLRIPLSFDLRTNEDSKGKRAHLVFGPDGGFLLHGSQLQISKENGNQKITDDFHLMHFRYGGFIRMGYGQMGIFAKYYFNDVFENSPDQKGVKNFSFGFTVGF